MVYFIGIHYELNIKKVYVTVLRRYRLCVRVVGQFQMAHGVNFISDVLRQIKKRIGSGKIVLSVGVPFDDVLKSTFNKKTRLSHREINRIKERCLQRVWGVNACDFVVKIEQNRNTIDLWAISQEQLQQWESTCECNQVTMACVRPIEVVLRDKVPQKRNLNALISCRAGDRLCWCAGVGGVTLASGFCSAPGHDIVNHVSQSMGEDFIKKCHYYYCHKPLVQGRSFTSDRRHSLTCGSKEVSMRVDFIFSFLLARSACYAM